ncbi:MAG: regulatory protein RecX [Firmicutes bacterium]|nr:regulatory protein RecX [Bacillota bacterium]
MGEKKKRKEKERPEAMDAAAGYISTSMRSAWEVGSYLRKKEYPENEIRDVIERMTEMGYIDDEEYCRVFTEKSIRKGHGVNRIRNELVQKRNIDPAIVDKVAEDMISPENERERAMAIAEKIADGKPADEKMKGRIGRRLSYYGFSTDTIYWVLGNIKKDAEDRDIYE